MTITDIDKHIGNDLRKILPRNFDNNRYLWSVADKELKEYINQIYTQAKAEQKNEDARIAEGMKKGHEIGDINYEFGDIAWDDACEDIAKEIRNQKED